MKKKRYKVLRKIRTDRGDYQEGDYGMFTDQQAVRFDSALQPAFEDDSRKKRSTDNLKTKSSMTKKQIMKKLDEQGIEYSKSELKADLYEKLQ